MLSASFLVTVVVGITPAIAADQTAAAGLAGLVRYGGEPLEATRVYAYQVTELTLTRATTGEDGRFLFRTLPAGVYKIIAHKVGFIPAVVLFTRATQSAVDFLEFELAPEPAMADDSADFWSVRRRLPTDVLREIEIAEALHQQDLRTTAPATDLAFETEMIAGLDNISDAGRSQLTRGRIGMHGRVGRLLLELDGRFDQLRPESETQSTDGLTKGRTNSIDLSLASRGSSALQFRSVRHSLDHHPMMRRPIDFERYQVQWSQDLGSGAESAVSAQYLEETGFHKQGLVSPAGVPEGSRTLRVHGTYRQDIGERLNVRTGVSYQEMLLDTDLGQTLPALVRQRVNAFGIGATELGSGVVVEYGLYSMLLDGTFALSPHGGVVLELGNDWKAEAVVRRRFQNELPELGSFAIAYFRNLENDPGSEEHYYRVGFQRVSENGESIRIGAIHREIGDTLRVFFTEDFFDQIESIYLVRGDELPEIHLQVSQRLAPRILATLESNVGSGGGGLFRAAADATPYENQVRFAVTSLDTQFQRTSTGVFLALHRVEQRLDPIGAERGTDVALDKLQLKLTQELGYFLDLGTDWAVLLNVELSRGDLVYGRPLADDLHRRIAGGVAVRF
ncbi:MAG TPA: carboxypeptidase-like regulatory domain-containing protein [Thermoanaerobaculia bacterium]|nr:carboxypeptidase-like regulatory domain-containing protein [Thermoanaerobaculia bacterium]